MFSVIYIPVSFNILLYNLCWGTENLQYANNDDWLGLMCINAF